MSSHTKFAVAGGTGGLGSFIVRALLENPVNKVTILSRSSAPTGLYPDVELKQVDYNEPKSLEKALKGIHVVISALGTEALGLQIPLVHAAVKVGVGLFVPSEFGSDTTRFFKEAEEEEVVVEEEASPLRQKTELQALLREVGMASLVLFCGPFMDTTFSPMFGFDFAAGEVSIVGEGNSPISFTAREDVANFLAHALTTLSPLALHNAIFRIEGDLQSFNDVVAIYARTHPGKKLAVEHTSVEDAKAYTRKNPGEMMGFVKYLLVEWEEGRGQVRGKGGKVNNGLWPDWKPQSVEDVVKAM